MLSDMIEKDVCGHVSWRHRVHTYAAVDVQKLQDMGLVEIV